MSWDQLAAMGSSNYNAAACAVGGKVYTFQGWGANAIWAYDPATDTWGTVAGTSVGQPWIGPVGGKVYFGGGSVTGLTDASRFDPDTATVTAVADAPSITYAGSGVASGRIYVPGGRRGSTDASAALSCYDPATDTWSSLAPMPAARFENAAAGIGGRIYSAGGTTSGSNGFTDTYAYDPATDTWGTVAPMPTAMHGFIGTTDGTYLYTVGGKVGTARVSTVQRYDPQADSWETLDPYPWEAHAVAIAVLDGYLYGVGGRTTSSGDLSQAYRLLVGSTPPAPTGQLWPRGDRGDRPTSGLLWPRVKRVQP